MKSFLHTTILLFCLAIITSCGGPSQNRAVKMEDLDKAIANDQQNAVAAPTRSRLTAKELIALSDCNDLDCVQYFMKALSTDFVHAKKGEFATLYRSAVTDSAGASLIIPMATLYTDINPDAAWKLTHTVHRAALSQELLSEFAAANFQLEDSVYSRAYQAYNYRYYSAQYPGLEMIHTTTYSPWKAKGLYMNVTWPCYVFEVRRLPR